MKRFLNIFGNVLLTILVILLIGYGWAFFEIKIMLKSNPEFFSYVFVQQHNTDMKPDLNKGDVAIVKKDNKYDEGDMVMFLENGSYKFEKVVAKDDIATVTKCNTCNANTPPIDNSKVIGHMVMRLRFVGWLVSFFKQKIVLIFIAIFGLVCVIASQFVGDTVKKVATKK